MSRDEIDAAIKLHAEFELLYDRPYEDPKAVRVAGPFTVESKSPHRSLAFAGQAPDPDAPRVSEVGSDPAVSDPPTSDPLGAGFEPMIIENLARAGIQNGRRDERLMFDAIESYPGLFVQAIGDEPAARSVVCVRGCVQVCVSRTTAIRTIR